MTDRMILSILWTAIVFNSGPGGNSLQAAEPKPEQLPEVLIIGDSISRGYTPDVVAMLKGKARVRHSPGNSQHTGTGLAKLDRWLGDGHWDVIHFNWGLWDLCYRHPESRVQGRRDKVRGKLTTSLEQYGQNLDELTARLAQTGAVLVWGHTTVVPAGEAGRKAGDDLRYNAAAGRIMKKHGVRIDDLNTLTRTFPPELFTAPGNVHFTKEGSRRIAQQVTQEILAALDTRKSSLQSRSRKKPLERILFGSCTKQEKPMPIFNVMLRENPELCLFIGDNIYGDTEDMSVLQQKYDLLGRNPGFAALRNSCRVLATWDDHDYGVNDGGADYPRRVESQKIFLDFWKDSADSIRRQRPGVYDSYMFGPAGQRVQVILLDTRYFRSPLQRGAERRTGGPWVPDSDPQKTMLGRDQWVWLEKQLLLPADIRIVASSIQCVAQDAGQETWSNLPLERARFFELIRKTAAAGVIIVSGDRHWAEISRFDSGSPYPVYDLTSSSFNQPHGRGTPTVNRFRAQSKTFHQENFGVITVDWQADPQIRLEIRDAESIPQITKNLKLSELQP